MAAKRIALVLSSVCFLQTSFAGFDRFWLLTKTGSTADLRSDWQQLDEEQQRALIQDYQELKELPSEKSQSIQKKLDWFAQLSATEQQRLRDAWQQMSSSERQELKQKLDNAESAEIRSQIRNEYIEKYVKN